MLEIAGFVIEAGERERQEFGDSTLAALLAFQRERGLSARGEVDEETFAALIVVERGADRDGDDDDSGQKKPPPPVSQGTVRVTLVDEDGKPLPKVRVAVFAQAVRGERQLGAAATGTAGECVISYARPRALNLVARAFDETLKVIAQSGTYFAAPQQAQIRLTTAADGVLRAPAVYTNLVEAVAAELQDVSLTSLRETAQVHELSFLASAVGVAFSEVAYLYIAQTLGKQHGVRDQTFFGIFYQGVPAALRAALANLPEAGIDDAFTAQVLAGVLAHSRDSLSLALTGAVTASILPASYSPVQPAELALLDGLRAKSVADTPYVRGKTPLSDLLSVGGISQAVQVAFTTTLADNNGQLGPTWKALRANSKLSAADLAMLDTTLSAGELLAGNIPLVRDTLSRIAGKTLASVQLLAMFDENDWIARLTSVDPTGASLPPALPGESAQDRIARFAKALTERFTARYPTTAFAGGLSKAEASSFARSKQAIVSFLVDHPAFTMERTNIDHYLHVNNVDLPEAALADLKTAQRLLRITPHYATVDALKAAGHESAQSVYFRGRDAFITDTTEIFGSAAAAGRAYARAQMNYATALSAFARYSGAFNGPHLGAFGPTQPAPDEVAGLPDMQALFGSLDYFQCEDCQSIYSPAAYLVDLLQYLSWFKAGGAVGVGNARDALLRRRPDLEYIALDCANTNVTLPYIDVVNEILEAVIAPPDAQAVIDTTGTAAERRALPQQVAQAAYDKTAGQPFPLSLPFNLSFAQVQAYIAVLGTTRAAVLALFAGNPAAAGAAAAIAAARLGISPEMLDVITGADHRNEWDRWGLQQNPAFVIDPLTRKPYNPNPADWVAALSHVPVLLDRTGLTLRELYQLLEVDWVTESGVTLRAGTTTIAGVQVLSPDTDAMTFTGLTADVLDRANRFLRLWRASGLTMWELDWALGSSTLDDGYLFVADALAVRDLLGLPFQEVLSFWMKLETRDVTSHLGDEDTVMPATYAEVFRNPAVLASAAGVFVPLAQGGALSGNPIVGPDPAGAPSAELNAITAALGLSGDDVTAICNASGAAPAMTVDTLNALLRYQRLATSLSLDIPSLITWIELTGGQPFGAAPADTLEFCRRLGVLKQTGLGVYDLDYLLRHRSPDRTALTFTAAAGTAVLQAIRDAIAKLTTAVVSPALSAAVQTIFVAALAAATGSTADVVGPVLLSSGVLPLDQATIELLRGETNGVDPANFPDLMNAFTTVAKAVALFAALRPGAAAFGFAVQNSGSYGWLSPAALPVTAVAASPYPGFEALLTAFRLNRRQPGGGPKLFDVFGQWLVPASLPPDVATAAKALAPALNASFADVEAIATGLGAASPDLSQAHRAGSLADVGMLGAIAAALDVAAQYRLSGAILVQLAAEPAVAATALAARSAVQAQYGQSAWLAAIQPVEDRLREARRDALVGYILGPGQADSQYPLLTSDDLYNYYLIDPEMSSCALTTRLLEASLAVQQFVQQCFLNMTPSIDLGVTVDTADERWGEWSWRQQFRLWQAARQVFCYPENYLLPELRRDASPFFTDLANDMRQSDFTTAAAETAIGNYLRKLLSAANLTVAAHYSEGPRADGSYVLHVFAHTGGTPDRWYYRARTGGTPDTGSWSPWQPLNLDIASQHLLPVIWDQRLYLVWPVFRQISEKPAAQPVPAAGGGNTQSPAPHKLWSVELAMSHLSAGQWQPKQVLPQKMYWNTEDSPLAFTFRGQQDGSFNLELSAFLYGTDDAIVRATMLASIIAAIQLTAKAASSSFTLTPAKATGSWLGSTATVQLTWSGTTPVYTVIAASGASAQVTSATLPMPESPLAVTEYTDLLPGSQLIDVSQDPTYPLIASSTVFSYKTPMAMPVGYGPAGQAIVYGSYLVTPPGQVPLNVLAASSNGGTPASLELLHTITNPAIVPPVQEAVFDSTLPFFIADPTRTYLVQPSFYTLSSYPSEIPSITSYPGSWATEFTFSSFYHPYARTFLRELEIGGIPRLMSRDLQLDPQQVRGRTPKFDFYALYSPKPQVSTPYPGAPGAPDPGESALDFAVASAGAYSESNWEVFYQAPMLIASLLLQNKKFQDALTWLEYIFNPTDSSGGLSPQRFWQFAPFNAMNASDWIGQQIQNLLTVLSADTQQGIADPATATAIQNWMADPYDPHAVASLRIAAYGKATVMRFLDTLIAWGDWYYSQYTAEMVGYAEQLYVLADMLLGPRPQSPRLPEGSQDAAAPATYASVKNIDLFSNALVPVENLIIAPEPPRSVVHATTNHASLPQLPGGTDGNALLFCVPPNPQLLAYWDTVAQRLYNIRHCLNLQGQPQPLPLYAPPVNPLSLIEGQAAGGTGEAAEAQFAPVYRFNVYLQRAVELANDVRAYGGLILSAWEKQDSEALAAMRAGQELDIQTRMLDVKAEQVTEAQDQVTALQNQRAVVQTRYNYYSTVAFMNAWEIAAIALQGAALIANGVAVILDITSGTTSLIPNINIGVSGFGGTPTVTASFGGDNVSKAATSWASVARGLGGLFSEAGGMAATMGSYQRRMDEWNLQASLASAELTQVGSQITAAQDRVTIAQKDQSIAIKQAANAQSVSDFLTTKYTNAQLYSWMSTQLTTVYTQAYQLAYAYAQQAQNAYNYELGKLDPADQENFVQFGYFDSQHRGLTAGESLLFDLRRMEARYLESNTRELELTKHISLALTSPVALVKLRETGSCQIALHEALFEYDHPGHYFRRLRSVAVTIPCVTGPYTGVNATLSLTGAMVRTSAADGSYQPQPADTGPLNNQPVISSPVAAAGTQTIATSTGQQDAGLFEVNLRDERWLPFEGQGAISTWNLTLDPRDNNFDFTTITDVVLHVRYTARDGGPAATFVRDKLKPSDPRTILVSVRNTFSGAWYAFFNPGAQATEQTLTMPLATDVFPYTNLGNGSAEIEALALYVVLSVPAEGNTIAAGLTGAGPDRQISLAPLPDQTTSGDAAMALSATGISFAPSLAAPQTLNLTIPLADIPAGLGVTVDGRTVLDPDKIEDVLLVITYSIG